MSNFDPNGAWQVFENSEKTKKQQIQERLDLAVQESMALRQQIAEAIPKVLEKIAANNYRDSKRRGNRLEWILIHKRGVQLVIDDQGTLRWLEVVYHNYPEPVLTLSRDAKILWPTNQRFPPINNIRNILKGLTHFLESGAHLE
jgi:hypothetical protein